MYWVVLTMILNYASGTHYRITTPLEIFQRNWYKFQTNVSHYSTKQKKNCTIMGI